ncbi:uncharacterized protein LOC114974376 [Acropora millepora]|uniref:uncharacterized protein LOC114974376 n=1 Tax=Acropora millepora TaxID=45264 RepID=UPI001CF438A3|nr:uncharacterized protein LOC114974376 [Acropora millepora]
MKCEAFIFFVIPLLAKAFHAWLQEDPYRVDNGFITYGGFHPYLYHSLTTTQIAITLSEDIMDCGFACIAKPKCALFKVAANPDSSGSFLCELLEADMYYDRGTLRSNVSFHHYSPPSPCTNHSCYNDSFCVPDFKEDSHRCKACRAGFVGNQCEREACTQNTTAGHLCSLPFKYKGVTYNSCTKKDGQSYWCSLDPVYRGRSGTCACTPKTTAGNFCSIPFTYKGMTYHSCTKDDWHLYWCSLDPIYREGRWENCANVCNQTSSAGKCCICIINPQ